MKDSFVDETKSLARNLVVLSKQVRCVFGNYAGEHLSPDLSREEHRMVGYICHFPGCISADLVKEFHLVRSTISAMVNSLVEKGFVRLESSSDDRRKVHLYPTDLALEQEKMAEEVFKSFDDLMESGVTEQERHIFLEVCRKIEKNAKEVK